MIKNDQKRPKMTKYRQIFFSSLHFHKDAWKDFQDIDLDTFFNLTKPDIKIEHCLFDNLDCRHIWRVRKTKLGNCMEFDLHHEIEMGHFLHLAHIDLASSEVNLIHDESFRMSHPFQKIRQQYGRF